MANIIKYTTGSETQALKKDNFYIGVGDVGKGPTSSSGYYNGYIPPLSGYTIYLNKASDGPSIYTVDNDAQLISLTSKISGQNLSTTYDCFLWFRNQTDKMVVNRDYEGIVTNGLILNLDAGYIPSYLTSGTTWYDLSTNSFNGFLINGCGFSNNGGGSITYDGTNDWVYVPSQSVFNTLTNNFTVMGWIRPQPISGIAQRLFGLGYVSQWQLELRGGLNRLSINYNQSGTNFFQTGGPEVNWEQWQQVGFVINNSVVNFIYNGIVTSTGSFTINGNFIAGGQPYSVGNYSGGADGAYLGNIASSQLYNRVLSASEVLQNYYAILNTRMIVTNNLVLNLQAGNPKSYSSGGTVWRDVSGYGNDFTMMNTPTFNSNNTGYFQFDGADDYAYLAVNSSISVGTACSLEMVVKNDYSMRMGQGGSYWAYGFEGAGFSHTCGGNGNISPYFIGSEFHHYVFTWNQAQNNHSMYRDGVLVYSFTPTCGFNAGGGGYFVLGGARGNYDFQSYGSPHIAQLRLYGKILTTSEVEQNFNLMKAQYGL